MIKKIEPFAAFWFVALVWFVGALVADFVQHHGFWSYVSHAIWTVLAVLGLWGVTDNSRKKNSDERTPS